MAKLDAIKRGAWKALVWTGYATATVLWLGCVYVVARDGRSIWDDATPAGQISTAILAGSVIVAAAIYAASRRPVAHVSLMSDSIEGLKADAPTGNVYIIAPNATQVARELAPEVPHG